MIMIVTVVIIVAQAQMVAKTMMGENHIGPGFIFIYLGARYSFIVIMN